MTTHLRRVRCMARALAFHAGWDAFYAGSLESACPHDESTPALRAEWHRGWQDAEFNHRSEIIAKMGD
jgi:ribosome modulation factor